MFTQKIRALVVGNNTLALMYVVAFSNQIIFILF